MLKRLLLFLLLASGCFGSDYFPSKSLAATEEGHRFRANWFSAQLTALQEEPIYTPELSKKRECYRFTWLRTFHRPVALRLEVYENGSAKFIVKVAEGRGGYEPGKLIRNETRDLGGREFQELREYFKVLKFFEIPSYDETVGFDGSEWIIEALVNGRYHVVARFTPESGAIHRIGMKFIEQAIGGDFTPIY